MHDFSMIFNGFSMTFAVFHDYPGLEYGLPKFLDFPGPVVSLLQSKFSVCLKWPMYTTVLLT